MAEQRQQIEIHGQLHQSFLTAVAEAHKHLEGLQKAAMVPISGSSSGGGGGVPGGLPPLRPGPGLVDVGARPMPVGPTLPPAKSPGGASSHLTPGAPPSPTGGGAPGAPPPGGGGTGAGPKFTQQDFFSFATMFASIRRPFMDIANPGAAARQQQQPSQPFLRQENAAGILSELGKAITTGQRFLNTAQRSGGEVPISQFPQMRQTVEHLGNLSARGAAFVSQYEAMPKIQFPTTFGTVESSPFFGMAERIRLMSSTWTEQGAISSPLRYGDIGRSLGGARELLSAATRSERRMDDLMERLSQRVGFGSEAERKRFLTRGMLTQRTSSTLLEAAQLQVPMTMQHIQSLARLGMMSEIGDIAASVPTGQLPTAQQFESMITAFGHVGKPLEATVEYEGRKQRIVSIRKQLAQSIGGASMLHAFIERESSIMKALPKIIYTAQGAPLSSVTPQQVESLGKLSERGDTLRQQLQGVHPAIRAQILSSIAGAALGPASEVLPIGQFIGGYAAGGGFGGMGSLGLALGGAAAGAALIGGAFAEGMPFAQNTTGLAMSLRTSPRELYNVLANGVGSFATPDQAVSTLGAIAGSGVRPRNASIMGVFFPDVQSAATFARTMGISPEAGGQLLAQGVLAGVATPGLSQRFFDAVRHASLRSGMTGAGFAQGYGELIGTLQQQVVPTGAAGLLAGATAFGNQMGIAPLQGMRAVQTLLGINQNFVSGQAFSGLPGPMSLGLMTALRGHTPHSLWGMMASTERGISSPQQLTRVFSQLYGYYQKGGADLYGLVGNQILPGGGAGALGTALEHMFRSETPAQVHHNLSLLNQGKAIMMGGHKVTATHLFGTYAESPGAQAVQLLTDIKSILTNLYQAMAPIVSVLATLLKVPAEILKPFSWGFGTFLPSLPATGGIGGASAGPGSFTTPTKAQHIQGFLSAVNKTSPGGLFGWLGVLASAGILATRSFTGTPDTSGGSSGSGGGSGGAGGTIHSGLHFLKHLATHPLGGTAHAATLPTHGDFLAKMTPVAEKVSRATGMPVKFLLAQWAHETGWGKSWAAIANLNFGGIKPTAQYGPGYDPKYAGFSSLKQFEQADIAALTQGRYNTARSYAMADPTDLAGIGSRLQQEGYAGRKSTNYGQEVAAVGQSVHTSLQTGTGTIHIHITHTPKRGPATPSRPHFASKS